MNENSEVNTKMFEVSTSPSNFYTKWVDQISPLFNLNFKEREVLSQILDYYYEVFKLSGSLEEAENILTSPEMRAEIASKLDINQTYFNTCLTRLRNKGTIIGNKINPRCIAPLSQTGDNITLVVHFNITNE